MFGDPMFQECLQIFAIYTILFVIPSQLFQVQIYKVAEIVLLGVDPSEHNHITSQQSSRVAPSRFYTLLIMHFEVAIIFVHQVD